MKIAIFTDTFVPHTDGIVTFIVSISKYLAKKGHEVLILCPKYEKNFEEPFIHENVEVERFSSITLINYSDFKISYPNILKAYRKTKNFNPDIIHLQTPGSMGILATYVSSMLKKPLVGTYHTYLPDFVQCIDPINYINWEKAKKSLRKLKEKSPDVELLQRAYNNFKKVYSFLRIDKLGKNAKKFKKVNGLITNSIVWNFTNSIYNKCDLITTPTETIVKELKKHGSKKPTKAYSNGVDLTKFTKKTNYDFRGKFVHVGRISYEKEVDVLIKAFAKAKKKYSEITLDIYGDGPSLEYLKTFVDNSEYEGIKFHGFVSHDDLPEIYRSHDVFLTASPIETQGLVVIEAMACGLPIIGVDRLALKEVIFNDQNGYIVKPHDVDEFSKAIIKIIKNKNEVSSFGKKSKEISSKHDLEFSLKRFETTYLSLIDSYEIEKLRKRKKTILKKLIKPKSRTKKKLKKKKKYFFKKKN